MTSPIVSNPSCDGLSAPMASDASMPTPTLTEMSAIETSAPPSRNTEPYSGTTGFPCLFVNSSARQRETCHGSSLVTAWLTAFIGTTNSRSENPAVAPNLAKTATSAQTGNGPMSVCVPIEAPYTVSRIRVFASCSTDSPASVYTRRWLWSTRTMRMNRRSYVVPLLGRADADALLPLIVSYTSMCRPVLPKRRSTNVAPMSWRNGKLLVQRGRAGCCRRTGTVGDDLWRERTGPTTGSAGRRVVHDAFDVRDDRAAIRVGGKLIRKGAHFLNHIDDVVKTFKCRKDVVKHAVPITEPVVNVLDKLEIRLLFAHQERR
eukprot:m.403995 g.403995  ORF g.403995 m.403995 type:complete len:318 (-) comp28418_c2_seq2:5160-6113(-)